MESNGRGQPPALILGGVENALSVTRSLGRRGVPVRVAASFHSAAIHSRYCTAAYPAPQGPSRADFWEDLLLGGGHPELNGSVVLPCDDFAIEFMASRREELARRYLVGDHVPSQQRALLDKQETLRMARENGIPAPLRWRVSRVADIDALEGKFDFPVLIKPIHSHRFQRVYRRKLLVSEDFGDLRLHVSDALSRGLDIMVCELIPGPDTLLSSYYTYIDRDEQHLFHFTKRVIRRSPRNFGGASYHVTEWMPETAEMGQRFFRGIGFRGLGNIEFKRDPRDGRLKVIEVNARFTAAQELLLRSGMDIAWIIYNHMIGKEVPRVEAYRADLRMWYPLRDLAAFRELRARGELSAAGWLRSIAHPQVLPFFSVTDPVPALAELRRMLNKRVLKKGYGDRNRAHETSGRTTGRIERGTARAGVRSTTQEAVQDHGTGA